MWQASRFEDDVAEGRPPHGSLGNTAWERVASTIRNGRLREDDRQRVYPEEAGGATGGIAVRNRCAEFRPEGHIWRGGRGGNVSLDHRVQALQALFLFLMNLPQYVVDSTAAPGRAALRWSGAMSERFRVVAQGIRAFHAHKTRGRRHRGNSS